MAWAVLQVPFLALSPDVGLTSQAIRIPFTFFKSTTFNGEMSSYTAIGINVMGTIMVTWLRAWRELFG